MKKGKIIREKFLLAAIVFMLAVVFGGCSSKNRPYSKKEAKGHVTDWLYDKYDEDFTITLFEKHQGNSGPFGGTPFYYYEALSNETGVSFSGTTSYYYKIGEKGEYSISDQYEEALYEDRFAEELAQIPNTLNKWGDLGRNIYCYRGRDMKEKSADYESYISDSNKVSITVSYRLKTDDFEAMLPELCDYLKAIYAINKNVELSIYNVPTPTGAKGVDFDEVDDITADYLRQELNLN